MERLVSSWSSDKILPKNYVFPIEKRPGNLDLIPICKSIPIVDFHKLNNHDDHDYIIKQIMEACQDLGLFQVINHGVPSEVLREALSVFKEFFELPLEEKSNMIAKEDAKEGKFKVYTSSYHHYDNEDTHCWRDALSHSCSPNLDECIKSWPQKPPRYREVVGAYSAAVIKLGSRVLELIAEGLGLELGYFEKGLSQDVNLVVNHYPPCPDPSMTLGLGSHNDPNLITVLLQGDVTGLQVCKDKKWMGVEPVPDALIVIVANQLEIVSNGKLRSARHRAVTNTTRPRTSTAMFIHPKPDCVVEPAIITGMSPMLYKSFKYEEFFNTFQAFVRIGESEMTLNAFKIDV